MWYGYALMADEFWATLKDELKRWLSNALSDQVVAELRERLTFHYILLCSARVDTKEEAERFYTKAPPDLKETLWRPMVWEWVGGDERLR